MRPEFQVHTMTDITGFGLIGHARELAVASRVGMRIFARQVRALDGALECVREGHIPGGLKANREFAECVVGYEEAIDDHVKTLLFDPQTAGGLLISVAAARSESLVNELRSVGVDATEVGEVTEHIKPLITVLNG